MTGGSIQWVERHLGHLPTSSVVLPPFSAQECPQTLHWTRMIGRSHNVLLQVGQRAGRFPPPTQTLPQAWHV